MKSLSEPNKALHRKEAVATLQSSRQRASFTDIERQSLRRQSTSIAGQTPQSLVSWFEREFGRIISTSSVYDILSGKYTYLDNTKATAATRKRRGPQWLELEEALFRWRQEMQPREVTGKELQEKARLLWQVIPACQGERMPSFSAGWLTKWRSRHAITCSGKMSNQHQNERENDGEIPSSSPDILGSHHHHNYYQRKRLHGPESRTTKKARSQSEVSKSENTWLTQYDGRKSSLTFDHKLWDDIQELYPHCITVPSQNGLVLAKNVLRVLSPVFGAVEVYHSSKQLGSHLPVDAYSYKRAISIMRLSALFQFRRPELDSPFIILEEWLFDYLSLNSLRSTEYHLATRDARYPDRVQASKIEASGRGLQHNTSMFSLYIDGGKLDILTRTVKDVRMDLSEHFHARVMITPPESSGECPITVVRLTMQATKWTTTLSTLIISFQTIRPASDDIFSIAECGTSRDLQMALHHGEASLTDCDPKGRSLINLSLTCISMFSSGLTAFQYALRGRNISTLKFLLIKLEDVDAYEVDADFLGHLRPLMAMLYSMDYRERTTEMRRRSECFKLMLNSGADPSLHQSTDPGSGSIFYMELPYTSAQTMRFLLDEGQPFVNATNAATDTEMQCPLIHLANWACFCSDRIHHNEKIHLLLERRADVKVRDEWGRNCLHLILLGVRYRLIFGDREEELKDILMSLVTAGAEIDCYDCCGFSVSQRVCQAGLERLWIEVLTECGYDAEPFLDDFELYHLSNSQRQKNPGYGAFAATTPGSRPIRLSFQNIASSESRYTVFCVHKIPKISIMTREKNWRRKFWLILSQLTRTLIVIWKMRIARTGGGVMNVLIAWTTYRL